MAYADFTDLPRRTASDKVLRDKVFNIAKNTKYDEYEKGIASKLRYITLLVVVLKVKLR